MKSIKAFFYLFLLIPVIASAAFFQKSGVDRSSFYNAMSSESVDDINTQLAIIKNGSYNEKEAFEGALLMKKAGMVAKAKEKLSLFKEGRKKLDGAIKKDEDNVEFCFLRLIIQEHAPKGLDYKSNIDHDSKLIRTNYKTLPTVVQQAIIDYSKKSKALKGMLP